jgi:hypothetical protein
MIEALLSMRVYILMPIALIGYSAACLGVGLLVWSALLRFSQRLDGISAGTILATAFILGEGILAGLWLFLALGGLFTLPIVALLSFIFAADGLYVGRSILIAFKQQATSIWRELRADTWGWQFIAGLTILLCLMWYTSLGRPLDGDASAFYFANAKLIAFSHHLLLLPGYEDISNIGLLGELHFAALMLLHSRNAARLFSWPTIIAAGFMLASLGRTAGMGRRGQWLTLSILFSSSVVTMLSGDGKVDLFGAALGLAAYYWAVQIRFNRTKLVLFLTGLFSGFAFVAKMSYIPVMVPGIILLAIWGYGDEFKNISNWWSYLKSFIGGSLIILAGLILALAPHLVKNGFLFHNPFSPFGTGGMSWLNQKWFGEGITRRIILTYPFALTYGSYWAQYGNLSPLILAFLPLAFFLPRPRSLLSSPLAMITLVSLTSLAVWVVYKPSVFAPRYILATLLLLTLLPARAAEYISLTDFRPRILAFSVNIFTSVILIAFGLSFLDIIFFPKSIIPSLMGTIDECDRDGTSCSAMEKINEDAQSGERVYLASFNRYWFRGDLLQCTSSAIETANFTYSPTEDDYLWLEFYKRGFSYLFIDKVTHASFLERLNLENHPSWVILTPIVDYATVFIYHMDFSNPPTEVIPMKCEQQPSSTIWEVTAP